MCSFSSFFHHHVAPHSRHRFPSAMACRPPKHTIAACLRMSLLGCIALSSVARAETSECSKWVDDVQRLHCYDREAGREPTQESSTALERRFESETAAQQNRFAITPYRPNYV